MVKIEVNEKVSSDLEVIVGIIKDIFGKAYYLLTRAAKIYGARNRKRQVQHFSVDTTFVT